MLTVICDTLCEEEESPAVRLGRAGTHQNDLGLFLQLEE